MLLDQLLGGVEVLDVRGDPAGTDVAAITYDSRTVVPGSLFCCVRGARVDGMEVHDEEPAGISGFRIAV